MATTNNPDTLDIGLDFGTTGSAMAYLADVSFYLNDFHDPDHIEQWPSDRGTIKGLKVPSIMTHSKNNLNDHCWGFQTLNNTDVFKSAWFKLLLESNAQASLIHNGFVEATTRIGICELPEGLTAGDMTSRFLKHMRDHLWRSLEELFQGRQIPRLVIFLTVPATSSPKARATMMLAAERARLDSRSKDRILLLEEPEAALYAILESPNMGLKAGEIVLVADLGGGTSDFAVAEVPERSSPRRIPPRNMLTGLKCGGIEVDEALYHFLNGHGDYGATFKALEPAVKGPGSVFHEDFEKLKSKFDGFTPRKTTLRLQTLGGNPIRTVDNGKIVIRTDDLIRLYAPVLDKIFEHITELTNGLKSQNISVTKIILVGGLSASPHVVRCLRAEFEESVEVINPENPQLAVAYGGAPLFFLSSIFQFPITNCRNRQLAVAYGGALRERYPQPIRDLVPRAHYGFASTRYMAGQQGFVRDPVGWVLKTNQVFMVDEDHKIRHHMAYVYGVPAYVKILQSTAADPPNTVSSSPVARIKLNLEPTNAPVQEELDCEQPVLDLTIRTRVSQTPGHVAFTVLWREYVLGRHELLVE
ncbi:hypothetical protein BJX70DRAFT_398786 [Aspergillus crustosus]